MRLQHDRQQRPIGHGFFHSGALRFGDSNFRYLYDCGAQRTEPLKSEVSKYCDGVGDNLELLFVSHLDSDHISGLSQLLARVRPKVAVLPYLSPAERLALIAKAVDANNIDTALVEWLADPVAWLSAQGIPKIILITPDNDDGTKKEPPDFGIPPDDNDTILIPPKSPRTLGELTSLTLDVDGLPDDSAERLILPTDLQAKLLSCRNPLRFVASNGFLLNWQFVTFVDPDKKNEALFRREVQRVFRWQPFDLRRFSLSTKEILAVLQDSQLRKSLATCYSAVWNSRNVTSMSVYSGPISLTGTSGWEAVWLYPLGIFHEKVDKVGWLGTGDSELADGHRFERFARHYGSVKNMTRQLALPHHGSIRSCHMDLLSMADKFVVSAGHHDPYGHPHAEVQGYFQPHVVTERPETILREHYEIGEGN